METGQTLQRTIATLNERHLIVIHKIQGVPLLDVLADIPYNVVLEGVVALTNKAIGSAISEREEELLYHGVPEGSTTVRRRRPHWPKRQKRKRHESATSSDYESCSCCPALRCGRTHLPSEGNGDGKVVYLFIGEFESLMKYPLS